MNRCVHVSLGEAHGQSTPRGDSTDFIQTTGEAHDPDDRKGGSRVHSVRLFYKRVSRCDDDQTVRYRLTESCGLARGARWGSGSAGRPVTRGGRAQRDIGCVRNRSEGRPTAARVSAR